MENKISIKHIPIFFNRQPDCFAKMTTDTKTTYDKNTQQNIDDDKWIEDYRQALKNLDNL